MSDKIGLYHFNASCEMAVGNGTLSFTPPAFIQQFERELELIPLYLTSENDYLLLNEAPSKNFIARLKQLKPGLPAMDTFNGLLSKVKDGARIDFLNPWGWSPVEHKFLTPFKKHCALTFYEQPNSDWIAEHRNMYGRHTALQLLNSFLGQAINRDIFIPENLVPRQVTLFSEVVNLHKQWKGVVVKAPWSSSGRGIVILNETHIHATYKQWVNGIIKSQGFVMCEPYFKKRCDISFHFNVKSGLSVEFMGQVASLTDHRGQFVGCYLQSLPNGLTPKEKLFLSEENLKTIASGIKSALVNSALFSQYHGVLGVDVLVYEDEHGQLRINPCMEINLRQNMGTVTLKIRSLLHPEAKGLWQVKKLDLKQGENAVLLDKELQQKYPLEFVEGKIIKGYMPLIEPITTSSFVVYMVAE